MLKRAEKNADKDSIEAFFAGNFLPFYERYLPKLTPDGRLYKTNCPFHDDENPSFKIHPETGDYRGYHCYGCGESGDVYDFYAKKNGLNSKTDFPKVLAGIAADFGIETTKPRKAAVIPFDKSKIPFKHYKLGMPKHKYHYQDASGETKYFNCRFEPKDFRQCAPDGLTWSLNNIKKLPYNLVRVSTADTVYIVEGEKDVGTLHKINLVGTCNSGGGGNWSDELNEHFKSKNIILIPDNDKKGREHMQDVAKKLSGLCVSMKWIELPGLAPKGDVTDFLKAFDPTEAAQRLAELVEAAAEYEPFKELFKDGPMYHLTDQGNAERLIKIHGNEIRYCHPFKRWYIWAGGRWGFNNTGLLKRFCKDVVVKELLLEAIKAPDKSARKEILDYSQYCETNRKLLGMLSMAESEPGIPILPEDLDKNQYLFNCKNGTINLKTGELLAHNPDDLIGKITPYNYDPEARCPKWLAHLDLVMGGNQSLIDFLQKAYGYCLTGDTSERKFFVCYGSGANGKSITSDVVSLALGEYSMRTPTETLLVKRGNAGIPNDVARLMGARFVFASESEAGQQLAESKIKDITGGERITARFMRGEWFEFYPEFKVWLGTNNKPVIKGTDNAIWDRLRLIPFTVRISEDQQRPKTELMEGFISEMPGIIAWLVQGCLKWQSDGLGWPSEVMNATNEYRSEMDILAVFLDDCCVIGPTNEVIKKNIYAEYEKWTEANGERKISKKMFGKRLTEKGFDSYRGTGGVWKWIGIGLVTYSDT